MSIVETLEESQVRFETVDHDSAFTASELAESIHEPGSDVVKSVLIRTDDGFAVALLPATRRIEFESLAALLGSRSVGLASEEEVEKMFPDVEPGVTPPFGARYGIRTAVDIHLAARRSLVFRGSTHREAIRMPYEEFDLFETPIMGLISLQPRQSREECEQCRR